MTTVYVGIDIAKERFCVALRYQERLEKQAGFSNDPDGFAGLAALLANALQEHAEAGLHLCLEPTGGYAQALCLFAYAQGWPLSLPNPKRVRDWAQGYGRRAKTDALDARLLAAYVQNCRPPLWHPVAEEVSELDSLLQRKQDLEQMIRQEKNRQQSLTRRPQVAEAVEVSLGSVLASLEAALAAIEQAIKEHLAQHQTLQEQVRRLQSVPGVGKKNVLPLLVSVARWQALTTGAGTAKALAAYAGLDPLTQQSGTSVRGAGHVSRQGNRRLRQQLYMGALGATRGHNGLRAFYTRLVARGKAKKSALVAAAHKILRWAWAVFRTGVDFDANKNARQPAGSS